MRSFWEKGDQACEQIYVPERWLHNVLILKLIETRRLYEKIKTSERLSSLGVTAHRLCGRLRQRRQQWWHPVPIDTTAPTVTLTVPAAAAVEVALNSKITATFSEAMTGATLTGTTFTVTDASGAVAGAVTYADAVNTAIFTPAADFAATTIYTAEITTGAKDLAGNPLAVAKTWSFTTGTTADSTAPIVVTTTPAHLATEVFTTQSVSVTFSEPMDPATITAVNFTVADGINPAVPSTLTYSGTTAILKPASKLATSTTYTATIAGVVEDLAGNALGTDKVWSFTTAATDPAGPQPPVLGEAGRFVILASQTITTTGSTASALTGGDLGIMDQARSYYAGFTEPAGNLGYFDELTGGYTYAHDDTPPDYVVPAPYASTIAFIDQTRTDVGIAYNFLAADPNPAAATIVCPTQLGGLTLTQGVYKTAENVLVTTGPLHLDAQGDPDAVFIFSIDGTLTVGAPSGAIILDNGAQAANVYFRTGATTTIETTISFYGNVFAWSQVNVLADANITGRLFALTNQVTLISDTVTAP